MDLRKKNYLQPIINIKLDLLKFTSVKMLPKKKKTSSMVMKAKKKKNLQWSQGLEVL